MTLTLQLLEQGDILVIGTGHGYGAVWVGVIKEDYLPEIRRRFFK